VPAAIATLSTRPFPHYEEVPMLGHERAGVDLVFEDHGGTLGVVPHLRVSLEAYVALLDELVVKVAHARFVPNQIVAITFGGAIPGRALSQALHIPIAYHGAESYVPADEADRLRMQPGTDVLFARDLITTRPGFGAKVLIVDDLADTGRTFTQTIAWLRRHPSYGPGIQEIQTACLWRKTHSQFQPNVEVDLVKRVTLPETRERKMPWIDQPLEQLYAVSVDVIEARIARRASGTLP